MCCLESHAPNIVAVLHILTICPTTGFWRLLDVDYMDQSFQYVLTLLEEEGWNVEHIPLNDCASKLVDLQPK